MKPVIGINGDLKTDPDLAVRVKCNYIDAVARAGGVPFILPPVAPEDAATLLDRVDAVVLTGGGDIDLRPLGIALHESVQLMEPRRQQFDWALAQACLRGSKPALGICLGMQMMAVAAGGKLIQHLPDSGILNVLDHRSTHDVIINKQSKLGAILAAEKAKIVSHHHQGIADLPQTYQITARAPDGVIEAFEAPGKRFLIGVQWHPERDPDAPETHKLFSALIEAARARR